MRFVDQFRGLLFDMNGTFMFGHDRLDDTEDFYSTYRGLGGTFFSEGEVNESVRKTCAGLRRDYDDPHCFEAFPSLLDATIKYGGISEDRAEEIAKVIAAHEVGVVPSWAAHTLLTLSTTHPLALVSNVWAPAECWSGVLEGCGAAAAFRCQMFSSSFGAIKPSPLIFLAALNALEVKASDALFVGDSIERDIRPAKRLGMNTALIGSHANCAEADITFLTIEQLLHCSD